MARLNNAHRWTRPGIGATAALVALLAATAAGCGDGETAASGTSAAVDETAVTVGGTNLDEWCGAVREVGDILDGNSLDAPLEELQPIHADVVALSDQLIAGIEVIDAEYRDDVLTVIEGQQMLSQVIVDATDATTMRAEIDEVTTSQQFVVAEGTYEWVGTTCGLDESGEEDGEAASRRAARASGIPRRRQRHRRPEPDGVRRRSTRVPRRSARCRAPRSDDAGDR